MHVRAVKGAECSTVMISWNSHFKIFFYENYCRDIFVTSIGAAGKLLKAVDLGGHRRAPDLSVILDYVLDSTPFDPTAIRVILAISANDFNVSGLFHHLICLCLFYNIRCHTLQCRVISEMGAPSKVVPKKMSIYIASKQ